MEERAIAGWRHIVQFEHLIIKTKCAMKQACLESWAKKFPSTINRAA